MKIIDKQVQARRIFFAGLQLQDDGAELGRVALERMGISTSTLQETSISYHPKLWLQGNEYHPALVFAISDEWGEIHGIQRVYLSETGTNLIRDGKKVKKCLGSLKGHSIKYEDTYVNEFFDDYLAVAEGPATALAVYQMLNTTSGGMKTWSTVSATGMGSMVIPDWVRCLAIFPDKDRSEVGIKNARKLAIRAKEKGIVVWIHEVPAEISEAKKGIDFLDFLNQKQKKQTERVNCG